MGDPMIRWVMDLIFFFFFFLPFLYTEFTSDVSQDSSSKFLIFNGNMSGMFLNHSRTVFKNNCY